MNRMRRCIMLVMQALAKITYQHQVKTHRLFDFIRANLIARGNVDEAEHWAYSSARNYAEVPGILEVGLEW